MKSEVKESARVWPANGWRGPGVSALAALVLLAFAGCEQKTPAPQTPPPSPVTVAHPVQKQVVEWDTYTGHLDAPESASVAARVSGLITQANFAEGSIVKKGDLLFVIDDRPFKADLDAKLADQQHGEAQLVLAKLNYDRLAPLLNKAATQQEIDEAKAEVDQAAALVAGAKAAVETSKLNLEWCKVLSPIDGRVGNKLVTVGNLVNGGSGPATTLLTTIQSVDPMYCYVDIDENSALKYQKLAAEGKLDSPRGGKMPCYVELGNETGFPHEGFIDFVDNHIDPATGTERIRGVFDNKSGTLVPGYFARLRIPGSAQYTALLIPDTAIGNDQDQRDVLVINKENKVEPRIVHLGALFGDMRSITSGLSPDDRVIINGQMHARPGSVVAPTEAPLKIDEANFTSPASHTPLAMSSGAPFDVAADASPATHPSLETTTGNNP